MPITVKYETHWDRGEKTFNGKTEEYRALSFVRKMIKVQTELRKAEWKNTLMVRVPDPQSLASKLVPIAFETGSFLKVTFINKQNEII